MLELFSRNGDAGEQPLSLAAGVTLRGEQAKAGLLGEGQSPPP